jgi:hypothetical protein
MKRLFAPAATLACVLAISAPAFADATPDATAIALFDEARKLMTAGKYAEAIPKLQQSIERARTVGALLNLGECYEKVGRTASAWAAFRAAGAAATEAKDAKRGKYADERAAAMEAKLVRLTVSVPSEAKVEGFQIKRDGEAIGEGEWGTAVPVDPGTHKIEAVAKGRKPWSTDVAVETGNVTVDVPVLAVTGIEPATKQPVAPPNPPPPANEGSSSQKTIGIAVGAIGLAGIAFGSVAGVVAIGNKPTDQCRSYPTGCPADGSADGANESAQTWATISTVSFVVGAVALAAGTYLFLTAKDPKPASFTTVLRW